MHEDLLKKESVLRIGDVIGVVGRRILVSVDKDKNLSDLFFDGNILRNVSVGSYVDIRKGFLSLIGKVDGENANGEGIEFLQAKTSKRVLSISLVGYLDHTGRFFGGTKELPLVGNNAYLLTQEKIHQIHNLSDSDSGKLTIAKSDYEGFEIALPVDGLMNSHIAIFGNTGSGKSNTLAQLYQEFICYMQARNKAAFQENCKILLFDFNGEYTEESCLTEDKRVYKLSTRSSVGDKIPLFENGLLDLETISILTDATEKTQKPFLSRVIKTYRKVVSGDDGDEHLRNIVRKQITAILQMSDKVRASLLLDYLKQVIPNKDDENRDIIIDEGIEWHNGQNGFKIAGRGNNIYFSEHPARISDTILYKTVSRLEINNSILSNFAMFAYIQLIWDVLANRAQNEHIAPVINKLRSKQNDIEKIFTTEKESTLFSCNIVIVSLNDVNIEMKKTVPLLLSKRAYQDHKTKSKNKTLSIIIDEAHNILSRESFREAESWKDYRLETFEEIIKEGRKFGVFVTISSQRPSDISPTITSQAHNYFIHRLINHRDLQSISNAVSYIDRITEESIPTLPTGTCVFSGVAGQMPLKIAIKPLQENQRPKSTTASFQGIVPKENEQLHILPI